MGLKKVGRNLITGEKCLLARKEIFSERISSNLFERLNESNRRETTIDHLVTSSVSRTREERRPREEVLGITYAEVRKVTSD